MNSLVNVLVTALVFSVGVQTQYTKSELDIAEEMLKDIGLHKKPDLKQANITLEEYSLMYKVYQQSVRQTEAIDNLKKFVKSSKPLKTHDFSFYAKPFGGFGRNRRSGFRAVTDEKNQKHAILMDFNRKDLLGDSALLENQLHIVNEAILSVRLVNSGNFPKSGLKFTLYQLLEESQARPEAAIVIDVLGIDNVDDFKEILEFDAADMVQSWILDESSNHGLRIDCDVCHQFGIQFINEDVNMALKVHTTDNQLAMTRRSSIIAQVEKTRDEHKDCMARKNKKSPRCCRDSMMVDFNKLPGFEFIQQPRVFDAHYCRGRCPPRFNMVNDHSMLQSMMHIQSRHGNGDKVPKPCCAGTKFRPLDILHIDDDDPTKLKVTRWKNVIVTECGCL